MKKLFSLLVLVFGLLGSVSASHIAGCDLTYTCIGGNDYIVTLSFTAIAAESMHPLPLMSILLQLAEISLLL